MAGDDVSAEYARRGTELGAERAVEVRDVAEATVEGNIENLRWFSCQTERLALVLGITCHAVYHAGQVQLLKTLAQFGA